MFAEDDVWPLLDAFDEAGFWWVLEGGWGIDALVGHQTRFHGDLDPVIHWEDYKGAANLLIAWGYAPVGDAWSALPVRQLWRDPDHREVDLHPVWRDPTGGAWQSFGSDDSWG